MMELFKDKNYFLFDGAMGTYYATKKNGNMACELANLYNNDFILNIHKEYIEAGANAIKTNTFGANRFSLGCEQQEVEKVIRKGWEIACKAVENTQVVVFADFGPIPQTEEMDAASEYKKLIDIFIECGATNFLFETFPTPDVLFELAAYIRLKKPDATIINSFAVYPDGYSKEGLYYVDIINKVSAGGLVDCYGLNCISGPAHMYRLMKEMDLKGKNIIVMPNSGYPASERGRTVYLDNSEYFAEKIMDLKNLGIKILGGCCGTTPRHIAAVKKLLESQKDDQVESLQETGVETGRCFDENMLDKLIKSKKPILVEVDPPFDTNWEYMLKASFMLKQAGVDMITIADSPLAKARADSAILAAKIQRETGVPTIPHITCRDKNLLGIKATLLGLHIEGVRNVLVITGDPIAQIERSNVKGVFSLNSANLANYIKSLNNNVFCSEEFKIAGALNVNAVNFNAELKRAVGKIENGISCFLTQAIYTDHAVDNLIEASRTLNVPIFAGIMPIVGYKNAQFINNEIPGINIDPDIVEMFRDKNREESEALGVELSMGLVDKFYHHVSGFYLMTPLKRTHVICEIINQIKERNQ